VPLGLVRQQRRRHEDGEGAGRVLDEEVSIGNPPVEERPRVLAVETDVAVVPVSEETPLRNDRRQQVDRREQPRCPKPSAKLQPASRRQKVAAVAAVAAQARA
jgi:hypothetical protein